MEETINNVISYTWAFSAMIGLNEVRVYKINDLLNFAKESPKVI